MPSVSSSASAPSHQLQSADGPAIGPSFSLVPFDPDDAPDVDALHRTVFGPGRFARTVFRLREGARSLANLSFKALSGDRLIGAVSVSAIVVGDQAGTLLGPLAVLHEQRDRGIGRSLLSKAVERAFVAGEPYVLLVGDAPYYAPFGFAACPPGRIVMPGPVDPRRLLIARAPACPDHAPAGIARGLALR